MNPVILLDEVDKVGADWRGDPSAALLEVLDPAQNHSFRDHYLDVEVDLSEVVFIATANLLDTIPAPLLDRMEIIAFDGYTTEEKLAIANGYLLPRQLKRNGLRGRGGRGRRRGPAQRDRRVHPRGGRAPARARARQAAARGGDEDRRRRGRAADRARRRAPSATPSGRQSFFQESVERTAIPGVSTGLAVTGTGGDVLFIEATAMEGDKGLVLTGQLGDVMKESARIALSYVRSHREELGIDPAASSASSTSTCRPGRSPRTAPAPARR